MGRYSREERSKFERKKRKDGFSCPTVSLMSIISDEMRRELMKFFFFYPQTSFSTTAEKRRNDGFQLHFHVYDLILVYIHCISACQLVVDDTCFSCCKFNAHILISAFHGSDVSRRYSLGYESIHCVNYHILCNE